MKKHMTNRELADAMRVIASELTRRGRSEIRCPHCTTEKSSDQITPGMRWCDECRSKSSKTHEQRRAEWRAESKARAKA